MNKITLVCVLLLCVNVLSPNTDGSNKGAVVQHEVMARLESNDYSFGQFRDLGKCRCIDTLMVINGADFLEQYKLFPKYNADLYYMNSALRMLVRSEVLQDFYDGYFTDNINLFIEYMRTDMGCDFFDVSRSSYLICEQIYADSEKLRSLYSEITGEAGSYYDFALFTDVFYEKLFWGDLLYNRQ